MAELALEHVGKVYRNGYEAIHDFSLEIKEGEFLILVGPSGCGKSTLLRMIAGLEDISSGELWVDGEIENYKEPRERNLAMVFQNYALYPNMSVYDNIAFSLSVRKVDKKEIKKKVYDTAKMLGIEHLLDRRPGELSGGQKQRVAIGNAIIRNPRALLMDEPLSGGQRQRVALGRAMVRQPAVFLLDEPLSNLDAKLRTQMRVELAALQHAVGTTTIYVTHDQTEAMTLGTRIVVMRDGKMQQVDTPANLYAKPVNRFVAGFIGTPSMNFFEAQVVSWEEAPALLVGEYRMMPCREDAARISRHGSDSVILGIRPENILWEAPECVSAGADYVETMILEVELLGAEKLLFFLLYGKKYVAKIPAEYDARAGEVRRLYFDVTAIHLFDCDSEMRI